MEQIQKQWLLWHARHAVSKIWYNFDWLQNKKSKIFSLLQKINLKNFGKGVTEFSKLVNSFGNSIEQLTAEINDDKISDKKNLESIWGPSEKQTPLWSHNDSDNLEKIWGKRKWGVKFVK